MIRLCPLLLAIFLGSGGAWAAAASPQAPVSPLPAAAPDCASALAATLQQLDSNPELALASAERTIAMAQAAGDTNCMVNALLAKARAQRYLGRLPPAEATLREAIQRAEAARLPELEALARARLGQALEAAGRLDQAVATLLESVTDAAPWPATQAEALNLLGHVYHVADRFQEAERVYQQALDQFHALGMLDRTASVLLNFAITARAQQELGESENLTLLALKQFEQNRDRRGMASALHNLGAIQVERGQLDLAMDSHREALVQRERLKDELGTAISRTSLAKVLLARARASKDAAAAARWREEAVSLLELAAAYKRAQGTLPSLLATLNLLADAYAEQGQYALAFARLKDRIALGTEVYNAQSNERFAELAQKFEFDRKATELEAARRDAEHARDLAQSQSQRVLALILTCVLGAALLLALLLIQRSRRRIAQADAAQRLAEQQLLTALTAAPAGLIVVDRKQIVLKINRAALTALCLSRHGIEEFVGQPLEQIRSRLAFSDVHGHPLDPTQVPLNRAVSTSAASAHEEFVVLDGREARRVLCSAAPVLAADGSVVAQIFALTDLTELRSIESEQGELRQRLAHAERSEAIHLALGGMAHDFSNQLAAALGYAELMEVSPANADELVELRKALARSADLVQQLQLLAGYALTEPRPVRVAELVQQVVEAFQAVHPRVRLETEVERELPAFSGDPKLLRQALSELLDNALHAGPDGRPIRLSASLAQDGSGIPGQLLRRPDPASRYLLLSVQDGGSGMVESVRKRALDPYFSTRPHGRGLGLPLVAGIVRAHRGGLYLDSIPNSGTRITLLLPVDPQPTRLREASRLYVQRSAP